MILASFTLVEIYFGTRTTPCLEYASISDDDILVLAITDLASHSIGDSKYSDQQSLHYCLDDDRVIIERPNIYGPPPCSSLRLRGYRGAEVDGGDSILSKCLEQMDHRSLTSANDAPYEHICPSIKMAFHRIAIDVAHLQIRTRYQSEDSTFELGLSTGAMDHLLHVLHQASNTSDILSANTHQWRTAKICITVTIRSGTAAKSSMKASLCAKGLGNAEKVEMGRISILESKTHNRSRLRQIYHPACVCLPAPEFCGVGI